jgi:hypothetical protein
VFCCLTLFVCYSLCACVFSGVCHSQCREIYHNELWMRSVRHCWSKTKLVHATEYVYMCISVYCMYVYVNHSHASNSFTHLNHVCVYGVVVMLFLLPNLLLDILLLLGKSHCITCMLRKSPWGSSFAFFLLFTFTCLFDDVCCLLRQNESRTALRCGWSLGIGLHQFAHPPSLVSMFFWYLNTRNTSLIGFCYCN